MVATIWEVWNDRHGDLNKGQDVIIRIVLLLAEGGLATWLFKQPFIDSCLMATAIFFLLFDYAIAYVLRKNNVIELPNSHSYNWFWFRYTAKKGFFDNIKLWRRANPWIRFGIKLAILVAAAVIYIL